MNSMAYGVTKSAAVSLAEHLAVQYGDRGICVSVLCPQSVLTGSFDYGARLAIMLKDVELGLQEAKDLGVPMWANETIGQLWRFAMTEGRGDDDFTSLIRTMEGWAGAEVRGAGHRR